MNAKQRNEKNKQNLITKLETYSSKTDNFMLSKKFKALADLLRKQGSSESEKVAEIDKKIEAQLNSVIQDISTGSFAKASAKLDAVERNIVERSSNVNTTIMVETKEPFWKTLFKGKNKDSAIVEEEMFDVQTILESKLADLSDELKNIKKKMDGYIEKYKATGEIQYKHLWEAERPKVDSINGQIAFIGSCLKKETLMAAISKDGALIKKLQSLQPSDEEFDYAIDTMREMAREVEKQINVVDKGAEVYKDAYGSLHGETNGDFEAAVAAAGGSVDMQSGVSAKAANSAFDNAVRNSGSYAAQAPASGQSATATVSDLDEAMERVEDVMENLKSQQRNCERLRQAAANELQDLADQMKMLMDMFEKADTVEANHSINPQLNTIRQKYTSKLYEVKRYEQALRDINNKMGIASRIGTEKTIQEFNAQDEGFFENIDILAMAIDDIHKEANEKTQELDRAIMMMDSTSPDLELDSIAESNSESKDATEYEMSRKILGM